MKDILFYRIYLEMLSVDKYYSKRKDFKYYKKIVDILKEQQFISILDVGARKSPILENLDSSVEKVLLDLDKVYSPPDIRSIQHDFYTWIPDKQYDAVLCLQVLEHLDDPTTFAKKLFDIATRFVIVSVPYNWKFGICKEHLQDPVDLDKLFCWTQRTPSEYYIVKDELERLICIYPCSSV
jgi:hypothetical protein